MSDICQIGYQTFYLFPVLRSFHTNVALFLVLWQKHPGPNKTLYKCNKHSQGREAKWVIADFHTGTEACVSLFQV